jgi:flagellar hook protein FlgE
MSLIGAFSNGIGGLFAASESFAAISNNMANSRTPGYRKVETEFSTLLGGIDLKGTPGGVRPTTRTIMDVQGSLQVTNRVFDVAIDGPGMFVFGGFDGGSSGDDFRFSRDGNLISIRGSDPDDTVGYLGNETGLYLLGWRLTNGEVTSTNLADLQPIPATTDDAFPGQATTDSELVLTLPVTENTAATQIFYFDGAGDRHSLLLTWTKNGPNDWSMQPTDESGANVGGPIPMTFDGRGNLTSSPEITIEGFTVDVSRINQVGSFFALGGYIQDGIERGEFVAYQILQDGRVNARYTNGATRALFKIPVATFMNPSALVAESGTMFRASDKSGEPTLNQAGDQNIQLVAGAVEGANFDIAEGFSRMIITQRAYDTAAQVVRTVDEMTQIVRDLKR